MGDILHWAFINYATIISFITFLFGVVVFCRKWIINAIRSIKLSNGFHLIFGDSPVHKIKEIHDSIIKSHNTLEIRQSISEKYLQIGIFMCEPETGKCLWSNDHLNEFFGLDSSEMRGFGWLNAVDPNDRDRVHEIWMYAVKNSTPYSCKYTVINNRDGSLHCVDAYAIAVMDDADKIVCYVGYLVKCS